MTTFPLSHTWRRYNGDYFTRLRHARQEAPVAQSIDHVIEDKPHIEDEDRDDYLARLVGSKLNG